MTFFRFLGIEFLRLKFDTTVPVEKQIEAAKATVAELGLDLDRDMRVTPDVRDMIEHVRRRHKELTA